MTIALSGAVLAGTFPFAEEVHAAKVSRKAAHYRDRPDNGRHRSGCAYFIKPHSCRLVEGSISPNGWCQYYSAGS